MNERLVARLRQEMAGEVRCGERMAAHTTWRVGGPADYYLIPADRAALQRVVHLLHECGVDCLPLGRGSNLLVRDGGFRGAVIDTRRLDAVRIADGGRVTAEGGAVLMGLVRRTIAAGLGGLERLAGIPGTVGGAAVMNAGAGGAEFGQLVVEVELAGPHGSELWSQQRCRFAYRSSAIPAGTVIAAVTLALTAGEPSALAATADTRIAERRRVHAVGGANAGSVFRNPPQASAWQLIDAAGLRGKRLGGAQVAERHSNFIVNCGTASSRDIEELILLVRSEVQRQSGIELLPEVKIVGEA